MEGEGRKDGKWEWMKGKEEGRLEEKKEKGKDERKEGGREEQRKE